MGGLSLPGTSREAATTDTDSYNNPHLLPAFNCHPSMIPVYLSLSELEFITCITMFRLSFEFEFWSDEDIH